MNIFVLSEDPTEAAQYHCDKHVVKMILESAQLLSTACRFSGLDVGYKATHKNHPCSIWVRQSKANYLWLLGLTMALNKEWQFRFGHFRDHKSAAVAFSLPLPPLPEISRTPFTLAMPDKYKYPDPVLSYRGYYVGEKAHLLTYTRRERPEWL